MKIFTMSYDDGIHQDIHFIHLLKKYGLKCTFNLNSGQLGAVNWFDLTDRRVDHIRLKEEELLSVYDGFEVACHTKNHPRLDLCKKEQVIDEVLGDEKTLNAYWDVKLPVWLTQTEVFTKKKLFRPFWKTHPCVMPEPFRTHCPLSIQNV